MLMRSEICLVILDVAMPENSGIETHYEIILIRAAGMLLNFLHIL